MYILIMVILAGSTSVATTTAEFADKDACNSAIIEFVPALNKVYIPGRVVAVCVPKASLK